MADFMAKMLDELMGRNRNANPNDSANDMRWDSAEVCKFALVGFCPHELFTNTKSDLGTCDKYHDGKFKELYEKSTRYKKIGLEDDFLQFLEKLNSDMQRRIRKHKDRLALTQPVINEEDRAQVEQKMASLNEKINALVLQAEQLGEEGKVDESCKVIEMCDRLKDERMKMHNQLTGNVNPEDKLMEVCEVCGCFLIVGDAQSRIDEHFMGKQHMGYAKIIAALEELKIRKAEEDAERRVKRDLERKAREEARLKEEITRKEKDGDKEVDDKDKETDKSKVKDKDTDKVKDKDEVKKVRSSHRDRSRSRDRDRKHGRSSDHRSDRGHDRKRRSRSRDRKHRTDSDRKHHHHRRSRSRDRKRSRSHDKHSSSSKKRSRSRSKERSEKRPKPESDSTKGGGGSGGNKSSENGSMPPVDSKGTSFAFNSEPRANLALNSENEDIIPPITTTATSNEDEHHE